MGNSLNRQRRIKIVSYDNLTFCRARHTSDIVFVQQDKTRDWFFALNNDDIFSLSGACQQLLQIDRSVSHIQC